MGRHSYRKSMDPLREWLVPTLYPEVPTFLAVPLCREASGLRGVDVAIVGVPYEGGMPVARTSSYSLLTPVALRRDSVKYGGFLPELGFDVFDHLSVVDYGDARIGVFGDAQYSIASACAKIGEVFDAGCKAVIIGGTEECASYAGIKALAERSQKGVGVLSFDAHGDNMDVHLGGRWSGASWIARVAELPRVRMDRHVHVGMRGPRNFKEQIQWFQEKGTRLYLMSEIRRRGITDVIEEAVSRLHDGTDKVFVSVDFDVLDMGCAPGLDEPFGLQVEELLQFMYHAGLAGVDGFSVGWIPTPCQQLHWIATWAIVYLLAGIARSKMA